ncbi:hypothetical protein RUND412_001412 [Rhizina undulata]
MENSRHRPRLYILKAIRHSRPFNLMIPSRVSQPTMAETSPARPHAPISEQYQLASIATSVLSLDTPPSATAIRGAVPPAPLVPTPTTATLTPNSYLRPLLSLTPPFVRTPEDSPM